jgi:protein-tyrosine phosphatase
MVDIHCHIVPGVDDGAVSLEMSLAMIEEAKRCGVTSILTTPHIRGRADELPRHRHHKEKFQYILDAKPDMDLHLGGEVRVTSETHTVVDRPEFTADEKLKYILLELEFEQVPLYFNQLLFEYRLRGIIPIVAHPERNVGVIKNPLLALEFVRQGARLQLTTGSLIGELGETFQNCALLLLECGLISFLASDAHNLTTRRFTNWQAAYDFAHSLEGHTDFVLPISADDLCTNNPRAVCEGTPLPAIELDDRALSKIGERLLKKSTPAVKRKRFFFL